MNKETDKQNKRSLNGFIYFFLAIAIFTNIGNVIKYMAVLPMCQSEMFSAYYNEKAVIFLIITSILLIVFLIGTLCKQKWGVIGVFCIQIANLIGTQVLSKSQQGDSSIFMATCIMCLLFALLLMLRSNGRSGWDVIFEESESDEIEYEYIEEQPTSEETISEEGSSKEETNSDGLASSEEESREEPK